MDDEFLVPRRGRPPGEVRSVCFVSHTGHQHPWHDGSTRYRCFHPAEYLRKNGIYSGVIAQRDFLPSQPKADAYVFHRPQFDAKFAAAIEELKGRGFLVMADYDDLIFGVENMKVSSLYEQRHDSFALSNVFRENARALRLFDIVSASTPTMADHILKENPLAEVHVVRNGFPDKLLNFTFSLAKARRPTVHRMGYFPGTRTHDKDFSTWRENIRASLERTQIEFKLVGELSPKLYSDFQRVFSKPLGSFMDMFRNMSDVTIAIAPLSRSTFTACKSNIKAIEAFLMGCYAISSDVNDTEILLEQGFELELLRDDAGSAFGSAVDQFMSSPMFSEQNLSLAHDFYNLDTVCKPLGRLLGLT
jgi:hypothetical protein